MQTSSTTPAGSTPTSSDSTTNALGGLGSSDFLNLLVTQLKYQDPMNPADESQFTAQLAQLSLVEGVNNLESTMKDVSLSSQISEANSLIGKQVSYTASDGSPASGVASSVSVLGDAITVKVGSDDIALGDVTGIGSPSGG